MVVLQGWVGAALRQFCGRQRNIRTGNNQGVDKFPNRVTVGKSRLSLDILLFLRSLRPGDQFQLALILGVAPHGKGLVGGLEVEPVMLCQKFLQIVFTGDFDVPARLEYVRPIEFPDNAEIIEWGLKVLADFRNDVHAGGWGVSRDGEVVDLAEQQFQLEGFRMLAATQALFVSSCLKAERGHDNFVNVLFPKPWGFRMPLQRIVDR